MQEIQWQEIQQPKAIRLLFNNTSREILKSLILEPRSVKSLAVQFGMALNAVHHQIKQLEQAELIQVVKLETRRGRSIKHYSSSAQGYFVPFVATSSEGIGSFVKQQMQPYWLEFMDLLAVAGAALIQDIRQAGMRIYNAGGYINTDLTPRGQGFDFSEFLAPDAPALMSSLIPIQLSREHAKQLQLEMLYLLEKYMALGGNEHYVVHVGLTPGQTNGTFF